jgi:hypothetical protein
MSYVEKRAQFIVHYNALQKKALSWNVPDSEEVSAERAFGFYCETFAIMQRQANAKGEAVPPCQIFGRLLFNDTDGRIERRAKAQQESEDIGITIFEWQNFNSLKLEEWNMALNDTWVVAGVNSGQPFYPASLVNEKNIIDTRFTPPLTIMGRELVGLALAGYREAPAHPTLGKAYAPIDKKKAQDFSLIDYEGGLSPLNNVFLIKGVLKGAGIEIG